MKTLIVCLLSLFACDRAQAQPYPTKPIKIIVGFASGTTVDVLGRLLAPELGQILGQSVVVENLPGASSTIAAASVAKATPDGYTLMITSTALLTSPSFFKNLSFNIEKDFAAIALLARVHSMLVIAADNPISNVTDLIAKLKEQPDQSYYAIAGTGSAGHLAIELFKEMSGTQIRPVAYKANTQALVDVARGEVLLFFPSVPSALPLVDSGRLRALAVSGTKRLEAKPQVPAMAEFLPGYDASAQFGVVAPSGTPQEVINTLHRAFRHALQTDRVKQIMTEQGLEPGEGTPQDFARQTLEASAQWNMLIKRLGIQN